MSRRKKVGFAAVFLNITRTRALPKETSIHTTKIPAFKMALKKIYNRDTPYKDNWIILGSCILNLMVIWSEIQDI